jgi:hypothetical protein
MLDYVWHQSTSTENLKIFIHNKPSLDKPESTTTNTTSATTASSFPSIRNLSLFDSLPVSTYTHRYNNEIFNYDM